MPAHPQRTQAPVSSLAIGEQVTITLDVPQCGWPAGLQIQGVVTNRNSGKIMGVIYGDRCLLGFVRQCPGYFEVLYFGRKPVKVSADSPLIEIQ